jgi:hypothetical protein
LDQKTNGHLSHPSRCILAPLNEAEPFSWCVWVPNSVSISKQLDYCYIGNAFLSEWMTPIDRSN